MRIEQTAPIERSGDRLELKCSLKAPENKQAVLSWVFASNPDDVNEMHISRSYHSEIIALFYKYHYHYFIT